MVKLREKLHSSYLTLEEVLRVLPSGVGLNIDLKYPTDDDSSQLPLGWTHDINEFVDCILKTIYKVNKGRSIIFSCFNPLVCNSLNWKQPNYAVFLNTFAGWKSLASGQSNWKEDIRQSCIKETVKFCKRNNLLGVMCHSTPLVEVPEVVRYIKQSGLILASFGDLNQISSNLTEQYQNGVDATMVNGIITYGGGRSSTIF
jgi:CDK inhibitor PHO81